jgi:hypothetical protein
MVVIYDFIHNHRARILLSPVYLFFRKLHAAADGRLDIELRIGPNRNSDAQNTAVANIYHRYQRSFSFSPPDHRQCWPVRRTSLETRADPRKSECL